MSVDSNRYSTSWYRKLCECMAVADTQTASYWPPLICMIMCTVLPAFTSCSSKLCSTRQQRRSISNSRAGEWDRLYGYWHDCT